MRSKTGGGVGGSLGRTPVVSYGDTSLSRSCPLLLPPPAPANSGCAKTAQPVTCKNMLNIYLAQLFSNSDCGNEKGCRQEGRGECEEHRGRGWREGEPAMLGAQGTHKTHTHTLTQTKKQVYKCFGFSLFIFDVGVGVRCCSEELGRCGHKQFKDSKYWCFFVLFCFFT